MSRRQVEQTMAALGLGSLGVAMSAIVRERAPD
jgi:hypothetical protein